MPENFNENLIILHLSDLHFGYFNRFKHKPYSMEYHWSKVIEKLKGILNGNVADLLVITGDLTSFGISDEFEEAIEFIENNFKDYINKKRLFLIPGNHDLMWPQDKKQIPNIDRFTEYYKALNKLMGIDKIKDYYDDPHFYKAIKIKKKTKNFSTIIFGLNSCLYTAYEDNRDSAKFNEDLKKRATINENDFLKYLDEIGKKKEYSIKNYPIRIALLHHDLHSLKQLDIDTLDHHHLLARLGDQKYQFEIVLHGHKHKKKLRTQDYKVIIGGGSLFVKNSELISKSKTIDFFKKYYNNILNQSYDKIEMGDLPVKRPNQLNIIEISYSYYNPSFEPVLKVSLESIRTNFYDDPEYVKNGYKYVGMSEKQFKKMKASSEHKKRVKENPKEVFDEIPEIFNELDKINLYNKPNLKRNFIDYYIKLFEIPFNDPNVFQEIFDNTVNKFRRDWIKRKYTKAKQDLIIKLSIIPKESMQYIKIKSNYDLLIHKLPEFINNTEFSEVKEKLESINIIQIESNHYNGLSALKIILSEMEKLEVDNEKNDKKLSKIEENISKIELIFEKFYKVIKEQKYQIRYYQNFLKKKKRLSTKFSDLKST